MSQNNTPSLSAVLYCIQEQNPLSYNALSILLPWNANEHDAGTMQTEDWFREQALGEALEVSELTEPWHSRIISYAFRTVN